MSEPLRETAHGPTCSRPRGNGQVIAHQRLGLLAYEQTEAGLAAKQALMVLGLRAKHGQANGQVIQFCHEAAGRSR